MRAIDTNVVVRLLARDDASQYEAAKAFVASGARVSLIALVESVWVLQSYYRRSAEEIGDAIAALLQNESLVLDDTNVVAAALESFRKAPSVGFADCLMLELARKAGHLPLGTFDRNLARLPCAKRL